MNGDAGEAWRRESSMNAVLKNSVERIVQVKLQPLTAEGFAPFGSVLDIDHPIFPEMEGGIRVMAKTRSLKKPGPQTIDKIATHFAYNQQFLILSGSFAMIVAPPPRNPTAPFEEYEFDYDKVTAFLLEPGDCVDVAPGVWHNGMSLSTECVKVVQTRADVDKSLFKPKSNVVSGDIPVEMDPEQALMQTTVEYISLKKRDNCILELVL
jgi:ureidoglycolate hydrolase